MMCKYCNNKSAKYDEHTGGMILSHANRKLKLGVLGSVETELEIKSSEYEDYWAIHAVTIVNIGNSGEFEPNVAHIKISYCPFCGRKLN